MGTILQFPTRNKGRVRKSTGWAAEGLLAIHQTGKPRPDNCEIFNAHREQEIDRSDFLAYLLETMLNKMPSDFKQGVRSRALADAALDRDDHRRIVASIAAEALTIRRA